ncbi:hypothetical protein [Fusobacterium ulcerans]|uniref:hypothetical protein n=1 Tax=Fusobacterium ulcerans TaxID=861 RepID=UPI0030B60030
MGSEEYNVLKYILGGFIVILLILGKIVMNMAKDNNSKVSKVNTDPMNNYQNNKFYDLKMEVYLKLL